MKQLDESTDVIDVVIGENVHRLLWRQRRPQTHLAALLRVTPSVLSKKLRGEVSWSARQVATAATFVGVEPGALFEREEWPPSGSNRRPTD